jgi:hypothetical protein
MSAHAQSESELLDLWGRGVHRTTVERGLLLLSTARPDETPEALLDWTVGRRDAAILHLREQLFGPEIEAVAACPSCGERFESTCDVADLINPAMADLAAANSPDLDIVVPVAGRRYLVRPPTTRDLIVVSRGRGNGLVETRQRLIDRCIQPLDLEPDGEEPDPSELVDAADRAIAAADPQAGLTLESICPACDAGVVLSWDVVAFVWRELHTWALHMLREIHCLAKAYGWTERAVLLVPPARRRFYLELACP